MNRSGSNQVILSEAFERAVDGTCIHDRSENSVLEVVLVL
jgi:hypothetical protein